MKKVFEVYIRFLCTLFLMFRFPCSLSQNGAVVLPYETSFFFFFFLLLQPQEFCKSKEVSFKAKKKK